MAILNTTDAVPCIKHHVLNTADDALCINDAVLNTADAVPCIKGHVLNTTDDVLCIKDHVLNIADDVLCIKGHALNTTDDVLNTADEVLCIEKPVLDTKKRCREPKTWSKCPIYSNCQTQAAADFALLAYFQRQANARTTKPRPARQSIRFPATRKRRAGVWP